MCSPTRTNTVTPCTEWTPDAHSRIAAPGGPLGRRGTSSSSSSSGSSSFFFFSALAVSFFFSSIADCVMLDWRPYILR